MFFINQNIPCRKLETYQFASRNTHVREINPGIEKLLIFVTHKPNEHKQ